MTPKIKLCGLTRECDIEWANELKPDYIGFVFAKKSRRYASPERAAALKAKLDPKIKAVGVFTDEPVESVSELLEKGIIDIAQLHGKEDEFYISSLRKLTDAPLIQAFRIDSSEDVERANASSADFVLLDSGNGGTGTAFDWTLLKSIRRPFFLAGGLTPETVKNALRSLIPATDSPGGSPCAAETAVSAASGSPDGTCPLPCADASDNSGTAVSAVSDLPCAAETAISATSGSPGGSETGIRPFLYGLDVSSGIETDGVKDYSKMAAFVNAARKES